MTGTELVAVEVEPRQTVTPDSARNVKRCKHEPRTSARGHAGPPSSVAQTIAQAGNDAEALALAGHWLALNQPGMDAVQREGERASASMIDATETVARLTAELKAARSTLGEVKAEARSLKKLSDAQLEERDSIIAALRRRGIGAAAIARVFGFNENSRQVTNIVTAVTLRDHAAENGVTVTYADSKKLAAMGADERKAFMAASDKESLTTSVREATGKSAKATPTDRVRKSLDRVQDIWDKANADDRAAIVRMVSEFADNLK